jgi:hypothetical protein
MSYYLKEFIRGQEIEGMKAYKKEQIKEKLKEAKKYCDDNDKSTEFMLEYMQDFAGVDLDCVLEYLEKYR